MDLTDLDNILLAAIKKTAGNPGRVNRWPQRHLDIETYWVTQYGRVVAFNSVSTVGGIVTTAALSVTSAANLLRCVANMTYFYGYKTGRQVEADDLIGVLALWLGKEPDSSIGQTYGVVKAAHYQLAKSAAINQTRKSITDKVSDSLATFAAKALAAKIAAQTVAGAVPVISVVAMAVLFIRDFAKIKGAIITFYDSYKVAAP